MTNQKRIELVAGTIGNIAPVAVKVFGDDKASLNAACVLATIFHGCEALQDAARDEDCQADVIVLLRAAAIVASETAAKIAADIGLDIDAPAEAERFDDEARRVVGAIGG
ncbi:MAG: hypothetical protein F9B45_31475 [Phycisphaera sp. RhM]|nr:hypothetical protein [Phycisphaera sp. RhM]